MVRFRHRTDLPGGDALLVAPLHPDWVPAAAELLASSFADSLAATLYQKFLQRQINAYLEAHINLPPKAVVLAALRMPRELAEAAEAQARAEAAAATSAGPWWQGPAAAAAPMSAEFSSSASNIDGAGEGSSGGSASDLPGSSGGGGATGWPQVPQEELELGDGMAMGEVFGNLDSALSSCDDAAAAAAAAGTLWGGSFGGPLGSSGSSSSEGGVASGAAGAADAAPLASTSASGSLLAPGSGAVLTSVLELSFSASTRSKHMTLQSPEVRRRCAGAVRYGGLPSRLVGRHVARPGGRQDGVGASQVRFLNCQSPPATPCPALQSRPYLCNMAVSEAHRRRGHGLALLRAAEALVGSLGESEIYLHTRQAPVGEQGT